MKSATPKKMGRPIIGKKKDIRVQLLVDEDTINKMDFICKKEKISRSELIRLLIDKAK